MDSATIAAIGTGVATLGAVLGGFVQNNSKLASLKEVMLAKFAAVDAKFAAVDVKFAAVYQRFDAVDVKFAAVDQRFNDLDKRLQSDLKRIEEQHDWQAIQVQMQQDANERKQMRADIEHLKELIRK